MYSDTNKPDRAKVGLFGGKRVATPVRDTWTGVTYGSKYQAGKALASEASADPTDRFAWYKVRRKFPGRLVELTLPETENARDWGKGEVRSSGQKQSDDLSRSVEAILCHKGRKLIAAAQRRQKANERKERYIDHIHAVLEQHSGGNLVRAFLTGAIDAMIYDTACSLDFTKSKAKYGDYSGYPLRKRVIEKIFHDEVMRWEET